MGSIHCVGTEALLKESLNDAANSILLSLLKQIISVCTQSTISFLASEFLQSALHSADADSIVVVYASNSAVFPGFMKAICFNVYCSETISPVLETLLPFFRCVFMKATNTNVDHQLSALDWVTRIGWIYHSKRQNNTTLSVTVTVLELLINSVAILNISYTSLYTIALLANVVELNFALSNANLTHKLVETLIQCVLLTTQRGNRMQLSDILVWLKPLQQILRDFSVLQAFPSLLHALGYLLMENEGFPAEQCIILQILEQLILTQNDCEERGWEYISLNTLIMPLLCSVQDPKSSKLLQSVLRISHALQSKSVKRRSINAAHMDIHVPQALDIVTHLVSFQRVASDERLCVKWIQTANTFHSNRLGQFFLLSLLFDSRKAIQNQLRNTLKILSQQTPQPKEVAEDVKKRERKKWIVRLVKMLTLYISWYGNNTEGNDVESSQLLVDAMYLMAACSTKANESTRIFIRMIESMEKNYKLCPLALRLLCTAWKNDSRLYPQLEAALCKPRSQEFDGEKYEDGSPEMEIVQMASILSICQCDPERGLDFVARLQTSLSHPVVPVVCLAIDSIAALCKNDCMDFFTAFKAVESKIRRKKTIIDIQDSRFQLSIIDFYLLAHLHDIDSTQIVDDDVFQKQRKQLLNSLWEHAINTKEVDSGQSVLSEDIRSAAWHAIRLLPSAYLTHVGVDRHSDLSSLFQHAVLAIQQPHDHESRDHVAEIMSRFMVTECKALINAQAHDIHECISSPLNQRSDLYHTRISTMKSKEVMRSIAKLAQIPTLSTSFLCPLPPINPLEQIDSTRRNKQLRVLGQHLDDVLAGIQIYLRNEPSLLGIQSDTMNPEADCIYILLLTLWLRNWHDYFRVYVHDAWTIAQLQKCPTKFVDTILKLVDEWTEEQSSVECPLHFWLAISSVLNESVKVHYDTLITKWSEILLFFLEKLEILVDPKSTGNPKQNEQLVMLLVSIYHHITWVRIDNDLASRLSIVLTQVKSKESNNRNLREYIISIVLLTQAHLLTVVDNSNVWVTEIKDAVSSNLSNIAATLPSNASHTLKLQEQVFHIFNSQKIEPVPVENSSVLVAWASCTALMTLLPGLLSCVELITELDEWLVTYQQVSDNNTLKDLVFCVRGTILSRGLRSNMVNLQCIQKYLKTWKMKLENAFSQNTFSAMYLPNLIASYPSMFIRDQFDEIWLKKTFFTALENENVRVDQRIAAMIGLCNLLHLCVGDTNAYASKNLVTLDQFSVIKIVDALMVKHQSCELATACALLAQSLLLAEHPIMIPRSKDQFNQQLAQMTGKAPILCSNLRFLYDAFRHEIESEEMSACRYTSMKTIVYSICVVTRDSKTQCAFPVVEINQLLHLFWKLYGCSKTLKYVCSERLELAASIVRLAFTICSCNDWIIHEFFQEKSSIDRLPEAVKVELIRGFTELKIVKDITKNSHYEFKFACLLRLTKLALMESPEEHLPPFYWMLMLTALTERAEGDDKAMVKNAIEVASESNLLARLFRQNDQFACEQNVVRFVDDVLLRVCDKRDVLDEDFVILIETKAILWISDVRLGVNLLHLFLSTFLRGLDEEKLAFAAKWSIPDLEIKCPYLLKIILDWIYATVKAHKGTKECSLGLNVYQVLNLTQTQHQKGDAWMMHLLDVVNSFPCVMSIDVRHVHIQLIYQLACLGQKVSESQLDVWNIPILSQPMCSNDNHRAFVYFLLSGLRYTGSDCSESVCNSIFEITNYKNVRLLQRKLMKTG